MEFAKLWFADTFPSEFIDGKPVKQFTAVEGFVPNQCETVGRIFQRVQAGQSVEVLGDFIGEADQLADTEMMDQFDFLDLQEDMAFEVKEQRKRAGAKKDEKPPQGGEIPLPPAPE